MKVEFFYSFHEYDYYIFDTQKDFGITDEEWKNLSDEEKDDKVLDWLNEIGLEYGWKELEMSEDEYEQWQIERVDRLFGKDAHKIIKILGTHD